jgi:hypothetical protein
MSSPTAATNRADVRSLEPHISVQNMEHSALLSPLRNMAVEVEIVAARLTRIKALLDALEPVCLQSEASRDTFRKLKLELEAARIAVRLDRATRR